MGHYKGSLHDNSHKKGEGVIFVPVPVSHFAFRALQFKYYNFSQQMYKIVLVKII
jgi:hypothetical protein